MTSKSENCRVTVVVPSPLRSKGREGKKERKKERKKKEEEEEKDEIRRRVSERMSERQRRRKEWRHSFIEGSVLIRFWLVTRQNEGERGREREANERSENDRSINVFRSNKRSRYYIYSGSISHATAVLINRASAAGPLPPPPSSPERPLS